jgi:hypothetical protein
MREAAGHARCLDSALLPPSFRCDRSLNGQNALPWCGQDSRLEPRCASALHSTTTTITMMQGIHKIRIWNATTEPWHGG